MVLITVGLAMDCFAASACAGATPHSEINRPDFHVPRFIPGRIIA